MFSFNRAIKLAAVLTTAAAISFSASTPSRAETCSIRLHIVKAGFIVGVGGGSGVLHFKGHNYPLSVGGLSVGAIGVSSYDLHGTVYHLRRVSDIEGTYSALDASATAGAGAGILDMTNGKGVEIRATSTTSGLKLSFAPSGVVINLKH